MICLNIEHLDEKTIERLKKRARRHDNTLEEEAASILRSALAPGEPAEEEKAVRAGDLATSLFGEENGVELDLPVNNPFNS